MKKLYACITAIMLMMTASASYAEWDIWDDFEWKPCHNFYQGCGDDNIDDLIYGS